MLLFQILTLKCPSGSPFILPELLPRVNAEKIVKASSIGDAGGERRRGLVLAVWLASAPRLSLESSFLSGTLRPAGWDMPTVCGGGLEGRRDGQGVEGIS